MTIRDATGLVRKADVFMEAFTPGVIDKLVEETGAGAVYWNRCYEPDAIGRDTAIKAALKFCNCTPS